MAESSSHSEAEQEPSHTMTDQSALVTPKRRQEENKGADKNSANGKVSKTVASRSLSKKEQVRADHQEDKEAPDTSTHEIIVQEEGEEEMSD